MKPPPVGGKSDDGAGKSYALVRSSPEKERPARSVPFAAAIRISHLCRFNGRRGREREVAGERTRPTVTDCREITDRSSARRDGEEQTHCEDEKADAPHRLSRCRIASAAQPSVSFLRDTDVRHPPFNSYLPPASIAAGVSPTFDHFR